MENQLRQSEERYRTLVESSSDAILLLDPNRNIVSCNQGFLELFGYNGKELEMKSVRIIHRSDESYRDFGDTAYSGIERSGSYRTEWEFRRKDGKIFPADTSTSAIKSPRRDCKLKRPKEPRNKITTPQNAIRSPSVFQVLSRSFSRKK